MPIHVAILREPYARLILDGRKTVESRLTRSAQPPFGRISRGERLFLKKSGGAFFATAVAGEIEFHDNLTPAAVAGLRRRFNAAVCGDEAYWRGKADARCATFVHLKQVEPLAVGPAYDKSGWKAWHVLEDRLSPLGETRVTAGAIRNRYARLPDPLIQRLVNADAAAGPEALPGASPASGGSRPTAPALPSVAARRGLTLHMPDGRVVQTDLARGPMIRWRGWGGYYARCRVQPGDAVRFVALAPWVYRVSFVRRRAQTAAREGQTD